MPSKYKGLFFDPKENRWRVRLYRGRNVVHLSYHRSETEAEEVWRTLVDNRPEVKTVPETTDTTELIRYLRL